MRPRRFGQSAFPGHGARSVPVRARCGKASAITLTDESVWAVTAAPLCKGGAVPRAS